MLTLFTLLLGTSPLRETTSSGTTRREPRTRRAASGSALSRPSRPSSRTRPITKTEEVRRRASGSEATGASESEATSKRTPPTTPLLNVSASTTRVCARLRSHRLSRPPLFVHAQVTAASQPQSNSRAVEQSSSRALHAAPTRERSLCEAQVRASRRFLKNRERVKHCMSGALLPLFSQCLCVCVFVCLCVFVFSCLLTQCMLRGPSIPLLQPTNDLRRQGAVPLPLPAQRLARRLLPLGPLHTDAGETRSMQAHAVPAHYSHRKSLVEPPRSYSDSPPSFRPLLFTAASFVTHVCPLPPPSFRPRSFTPLHPVVHTCVWQMDLRNGGTAAGPKCRKNAKKTNGGGDKFEHMMRAIEVQMEQLEKVEIEESIPEGERKRPGKQEVWGGRLQVSRRARGEKRPASEESVRVFGLERRGWGACLQRRGTHHTARSWPPIQSTLASLLSLRSSRFAPLAFGARVWTRLERRALFYRLKPL